MYMRAGFYISKVKRYKVLLTADQKIDPCPDCLVIALVDLSRSRFCDMFYIAPPAARHLKVIYTHQHFISTTC